MLRAPCFDPATRTDCPNRAVGCRGTCPKWQQYEAEKEVEYAKVMAQRKNTNALIEYGIRSAEKLRREYRG